jgi:hypothetical protein
VGELKVRQLISIHEHFADLERAAAEAEAERNG